MSRRVGQVTATQAVAGLFVALLCLAVVVALTHALIVPGSGTRELPAPAAGVPVPGRPCPQPDDPLPDVVTSAALYECPHSYDGRVVEYHGEAVGAILRRRTVAWVQLNDDPYGIVAGPLPEHRTSLGGNSGLAVLVPASAADRIRFVGGHRAHGDALAVRGVFIAADPLDGGAPTLHAESVEVLRDGRLLQHRTHPRLVVAAAGATVAALATGGAVWRSRRRRFGP